MKVTIIFKNENKSPTTHQGQDFDVVGWEVHNSYKFLELKYADKGTLQFNLDNIFSFRADGASDR